MHVRMKDSRDPNLMSLSDVAHELGVSQPTVSAMKRDGQIAVVIDAEKKGQTVWVHRDEVERLKREYKPRDDSNKGGRGKRRQLAGA